MYRKQYDELLNWKNRSNRKPLIIRGARQVGKTFLVREFAREEFEHYIELNFDESPSKKELFTHNDINTIIQYLSLDSGIPVIPGKTLIFLDEIQRAPEVFAKLRYFFEKRNDVHLIAAGSLLDFVLANHTFSMPVGRIEYMYMGPMDFMEYLLASDAGMLHDFIRNYQISDTIPELVHQKLLEHVRIYMSVGGMPSALREYTGSKSIRQCEMELSSILNTYRDDFSKYQRKVDPYRLQLILDKAPGLIGRKIKYTEISREERSSDLKTAMSMLELARVLYQVHHSSGNAIPLRVEKKERDFKLLFLDTGLVMRSLGLNLLDIRNKQLMTANRGALAEQFAGQQWFNGQESYTPPELYYWNRENPRTSSEVDYLFQIDGKIIPVEIKAGTTGSLKSLHVFASEKRSNTALRYNLDKPAVSDVTSRIPGKNIHTFKLISLPLYMISETRRLVRSMMNQ